MPNLLVTGASGQLGQGVLRHLIDTLGVDPRDIAAASRNPDALSAWSARGVEPRRIDFNDAASLASAFKGIGRVLLISTDSMEPGVRLAQHLAAVKAAETAGVGHVVYTSLPDPEHSLVTFAPDHLGTEKALSASTLPGWSVLRNNWYFENLLHALPHAFATGQWYTAAGDGKTAYILRDDLARGAATALADGFAGKRTLELGGSRGFTVDEVATLASKAAGKPLAVVQVPVEGLVQSMIGAGMPEGVARLFASFDANIAAGGLSKVTGDYKALTGVDPTPFETWVAANGDALSANAG